LPPEAVTAKVLSLRSLLPRSSARAVCSDALCLSWGSGWLMHCMPHAPTHCPFSLSAPGCLLSARRLSPWPLLLSLCALARALCCCSCTFLALSHLHASPM
jgi:hypothetical protein